MVVIMYFPEKFGVANASYPIVKVETVEYVIRLGYYLH